MDACWYATEANTIGIGIQLQVSRSQCPGIEKSRSRSHAALSVFCWIARQNLTPEISDCPQNNAIHQTRHHNGSSLAFTNLRAGDGKRSATQGMSPKNPQLNSAQKQQLIADQRRRNQGEGVFGSGKRKYAIKLIIARLIHGAKTSISMAFQVMCAEKILRLLHLFPVIIYSCVSNLLQLCTPWGMSLNLLVSDVRDLAVVT